jgi:D-psicose/D-tagatose/L-ribulose 3-epimerase
VNELGIHALVWTEGWSEEECRRAVDLTKETGYDLIEIPLLDPTAVDVEMTRAVLEDAEVGAACSLGLAFDTDVSSADRSVSARGEELLAAAIDVTSAIGAAFLGGVVHSAMASTSRDQPSAAVATASSSTTISSPARSQSGGILGKTAATSRPTRGCSWPIS